jgi:tetratricopeptide (TPR) repeat protein
MVMGDIQNSKRVFEEALTFEDEPRMAANLANIHNGLGVIAAMASNYEEARIQWENSLELLKETGDLASAGSIMVNLANLAFNRGDLEAAHHLYSESAEMQRKIGNLPALAMALSGVGQTATERGDPEEAERVLAEAVEMRRKIDDRQGLGFSLMNLAKARGRLGRRQESLELSNEALEIAGEVRNPQFTASLSHVGGEILLEFGDPIGAARLMGESIEIYNSLSDRKSLAACMELVAGCISKTSPSREALVLLGAAEALRDQVGATKTAPDHALTSKIEEEVSRTVSSDDADAARREGRSMELTAAVDLALREAKAIRNQC